MIVTYFYERGDMEIRTMHKPPEYAASVMGQCGGSTSESVFLVPGTHDEDGNPIALPELDE
jgi:hypothetical protein